MLAKKSLEEGLRPFEGKGVSLNIGVPCIVSLDKRRVRFKACIKYIGHLDGVSRYHWASSRHFADAVIIVERALGGGRGGRL